MQAECEELSVRREKVSLCAVSRCSPNHIRANESIPPSVMAPPVQGPRKEQAGGGREGGRDEEWQEGWDMRDRKRKMIEL